MFNLLSIVFVLFTTARAAAKPLPRQELCKLPQTSDSFKKVFLVKETIYFGDSTSLARLNIEKEEYTLSTSIGQIFAQNDALFMAAIHFGPLGPCSSNESSTCQTTKQKAKDLVLTLTTTIGAVAKATVKGYKVAVARDGDYFQENSNLPWDLKSNGLVQSHKFWVQTNLEGIGSDITQFEYNAMTFDESSGTMYMAVVENRAQGDTPAIYFKQLDDDKNFGEWHRNQDNDQQPIGSYGGLIDYQGRLYAFEGEKGTELDKSTLTPIGETLSIHNFLGCDNTSNSSPLNFGTPAVTSDNNSTSSDTDVSDVSDVSDVNPGESDAQGGDSADITTTTQPPDPTPKPGSSWIIWLIIIMAITAIIIIIMIILCFCCGQKSDQPEEKVKSGPDSKIVSESDKQKDKTSATAMKSTAGSHNSKALAPDGSKSKTSSKSIVDSENVSSVRSGAV